MPERRCELNYTFTTPDHPGSTGKKARDGDFAYELYFRTDDGGKLTVRVGTETMVKVAAVVLRILEDEPDLKLAAHQLSKKITKG